MRFERIYHEIIRYKDRQLRKSGIGARCLSNNVTTDIVPWGDTLIYCSPTVQCVQCVH